MTPNLEWWVRLTGGLAVEAVLLLGVAAVGTRLARFAQLRRLIWQSAFVALALIWTMELSGARERLSLGGSPSLPGRKVTARVLEEPPQRANIRDVELASAEPDSQTVLPLATEAQKIQWWPGGLWLLGLTAVVLRAFARRLWVGWRLRQSLSQKAPRVAHTHRQHHMEESLTSSITPVAVRPAIERLRAALGIGPVHVVTCPILRGPVAFGLLRPTIALPDDFEARFTPVQCESMLAHELGHLAQRDPVWLFFVELICAVAWWLPMVWWARRQFRSACEAAADEACTLVPDGRLALAEALVKHGRELLVPNGVGVAGSGLRSELAQRVEALLEFSDAPRTVGTTGRCALCLVSLMLLSALLLAPWPGDRGGLAPLITAIREAVPAVDGASGQRPKEGQIDRTATQASADPKSDTEKSNPISGSKETEPDAMLTGRIAFLEFPGETLRQASDRLLQAARNLTGENQLREIVIVDNDIETVPVRLREALQNVTLHDAVDALTQAVQMPVQSSLEAGVLLFSRRAELSPEAQEQMQTALRELKEATLALRTARDIAPPDVSLVDSRVARYEKARREAHEVSRQVHFATRRFRLSPDAFLQQLKPFMPGNVTNYTGVLEAIRSAGGFPTSVNRGEPKSVALQLGVKAFCETNGVKFTRPGETGPPSDATAVFYNDRTGMLFVRATLSNLEQLESALQKLNLGSSSFGITAASLDGVRNEIREQEANVVTLSAQKGEDAPEVVIALAVLSGLKHRLKLMEVGGDGVAEGLAVTRRSLEMQLGYVETSLSEMEQANRSNQKSTELLRKRDSLRGYLKTLPEVPAGLQAGVGVAGFGGGSVTDVGAPRKPVPEVTLAVTLVEIADGGMNDVGLDWVFGQMATNNPPILSTFATNLPGMTKPLRGDQVRVDRLAIEGQASVLGREQYLALLERLKERHQVDVLSAPQVRTHSGRMAQVSVTESRSVVVGVQDTEGSPTTSANRKYLTEDLPVGVVLDLLPTAEGEGWKVKVIASVTEFLGYDDPKQTGVDAVPSEKAATSKPGAPLPRLRVREAQAIATAQVGEVIALRGPLAESVVHYKDKVPVLGDIPLLGRLFRSESSQTQRKRLYVFVRPETSGATGTETKSK